MSKLAVWKDDCRRYALERITIIGMGPVGASIGLGLKRAKLSDTEIVGTSGDRKALSEVEKMGAVDSTNGNLRSALQGAQLVVLDVPIADMREMLESIAPILERGCVLTDTGSTKAIVMEWAEELLPEGVGFVGGHPLTKKDLFTLDHADASVFDDEFYCVIPSKTVDDQSVKTVVGMVEALRGKPIFLDPDEHDSYASAMMYLPIAVSSAFVMATASSDGWREMHRLAASDFGDMSRLASNDPLDNEAACLANSESLAHWIDQMIGALIEFRDQIKEHDDKLIDTFIKVWEYRARWEANAMDDPDGPMLPSASESMATAFFGDRIVKRFQSRKGEDEKSSRWKYSRKN